MFKAIGMWKTDRGKKVATFTTTIPEAGDYEIRLLYTAHENRSVRTKMTITGASKAKSVRIDQRQPAIQDGVPKAQAIFPIGRMAFSFMCVWNSGNSE